MAWMNNYIPNVLSGCNYLSMCGWGVGAFLRWWPPSTKWAGPLTFYGHHWGCVNNLTFLNLGLYAACWAHFMCHHELWPTSVSHPFSFLNSALGLAGGKYYQKITIPIFDLFFKILQFEVTFLIFFSISIFSPDFWLGCYCSMWLYFSHGN